MLDHVTLAVSNLARACDFYDRALMPLGIVRLAAGGRDNGKPGPRPHYRPDYYGAFVLDPDGHNIEAVCYEPT